MFLSTSAVSSYMSLLKFSYLLAIGSIFTYVIIYIRQNSVSLVIHL